MRVAFEVEGITWNILKGVDISDGIIKLPAWFASGSLQVKSSLARSPWQLEKRSN
jgi:hypothetical protein